MRSLTIVSLSLLILCVSGDDSTLFKSELSDSRHLLRHQTKPNSIEDKTLLEQTKDIPYYVGYNEFVVIENGDFGEWLDHKVMNDGYLACGMAIKDEGGQDWGDDSSNNAIKIISCLRTNWNAQSSVLLNEGIWGIWNSDVMCPYNTFIHGVRVKYETPVSDADNTGMNGLEIKCKGLSFGSSTVKLEYGGWGEWKEWTEFTDKYVCGGRVRFQQKIENQDNTALNGLALKFCSVNYIPGGYTIIEDGYWGDWLENKEAPDGYFGCSMNVRYQSDQGSGDDTTLNEVKIIYCQFNHWNKQFQVDLNQGIYGDWKVISMCPKDSTYTRLESKVSNLELKV